MTAEVAILNKSAIALAADSAVTVGGDDGKIYNTVNKLFALNKSFPVGIMVYANADYMGVPFETVIKLFRRAEKKPESTIEGYAGRLAKFLESSAYSSDVQQRQNITRVWNSAFDDIDDDVKLKIREEIRSKGECSTTRQKELFAEIVDFHLNRLENAKVAGGFGEG